MPSITNILMLVTNLTTNYLHRLGLLNANEWSSMTFNLLESILNLRSPSNTFANEVDRLLADLIGAWNVVCRPPGIMKDLPTYESTSLNWSHLPSISPEKVLRAFRQDGVEKCFSMLTPSLYQRQATHIPIIAVATYVLLLDSSIRTSISADVQHLRDTIAKVLATPGLDVAQYATRHSQARSDVYQYAIQNWKAAQRGVQVTADQASKPSPDSGLVSDTRHVQLAPTLEHRVQRDECGAATTDGMPAVSEATQSAILIPPTSIETDILGKGKARSHEAITFRDPVKRRAKVSIQSMRTKLDEAMLNKDANRAIQLWTIASEWRFQPKSSDDKMKEHGGSVLTVFLLNKFIYTFMALRQPNRAIDVWNAMMKNGVTPNVEAWNAMLSGGRISRDAPAFDKIWQQMCARNVGLSKESWNIRISGLIDMWKLQDGLRTLDEMGRLWLSAAKAQHPKTKTDELFRLEESRVSGAIKPSIETVNMTIAALLKKKKAEAVRPVLTWAARFGIGPSAFTYNVLLRPLIRSGDTVGAKALIEEMKAANVSPDAGTFVTIIDETLRMEDNYSPEEQANAINDIFQEMEAAGLEPTQGLYGHIIHGLIDNLKKHGSSDLSVVNTVMARMASQGWQPGSVEYTDLAKFLFDQHPPDIKGVDNLIARSRLNAKGLNHVFWDSVLEGYARTGETAKALQVYQESKQKGGWQADHSKIAWRALRELLMALTRDGEWDTARAVVAHKVMENGGVVLQQDHDVVAGGHVSQFAFWELARSLDLLQK